MMSDVVVWNTVKDAPFLQYTNMLMSRASDAEPEANLGTFWQSVPHHRLALQISKELGAYDNATSQLDAVLEARVINSQKLVSSNSCSLLL